MRYFRSDFSTSLTDIDAEDDTMLMKADGSWMRKSSKLKQISSLHEYFISYPLLEEWSVMNGWILPGERLDHGNYVRRLAQYAQTYSWAAVIAFDDEFRRQLHANNLVLRWRDEAVGLVMRILLASVKGGSGGSNGGGGSNRGGGGNGGGNGGHGGGNGGGNKRKADQLSGNAWKKAKFAQSGATLDDGRTVCFNFNRFGCQGKTRDGTDCERAHVCLHCGADDHTLAGCSGFSG
jgi:hypothetical protein